MNEGFIDPYVVVTNTVLAQLEKGVVPWRCPWNRKVGRPRNSNTGQPYHGVNLLLLGSAGFASPYWLTWNQIKARGGSVVKGEHGTIVVKYGQFKKKVVNDGVEEEKTGTFLKGYRVFNALQVKDIEFPEAVAPPAPDASETEAKAEEIVNGMPEPPMIRQGRYIRACYARVSDTIDMPGKESFDTPEHFYLTLFHELVHATGHEKRLSRPTLIEHDGFGGQVYSQEELVAEMGAAYLAMEADIVRDNHQQSAAYLQGWLSALKDKDHRRWIVQAASQAGKAANFILNFNEVPQAAPQPAVA